MAIDKRTHQRVYEACHCEGREIIKDYLEDDDILDLALEFIFRLRNGQKKLNRSTDEELTLFVSNYLDGLEDGVRSQLNRELMTFKKWLRDA